MEDFRVAMSADFIYEVGSFFFDCNSEYVVLTRS